MLTQFFVISCFGLLTCTLSLAQVGDLRSICDRLAREAAGYSCRTNAAGNHTTIEVASSGIIEWRDFRVPAGHTLEFKFQDTSQWVVNHVVSPRVRSFVDGQVLANGKFALINPQAAIEVRSQVKATETLLATTGIDPQTVFADESALAFQRVGQSNNQIVIEDQALVESTHGDVTIIAGGSIRSDGRVNAARSLRITTFGDNGYQAEREVAFSPQGGRGYVLTHRGQFAAGSRFRKGVVEINVAGMTLNGLIMAQRKGSIRVDAAGVGYEPGGRYQGPPVSRVVINAKENNRLLGFRQDDGNNPSRLPSLMTLSSGRAIGRLESMNPATSVAARQVSMAPQRLTSHKVALARSTRHFSQVYRQAKPRKSIRKSQPPPKPKRR